MGTLRRLRWLFAFMLVASPAIGGQVLPAMHPCGVALEHAGAHDGDHAGHGASHTTAPTDGAHCICVGDCAPVAPATAPVAVEVAALDSGTPAPQVSITLRAPTPPASPPLLRLPPTTAPPA
jgi:hypothetical protein